MGTNSRRPPLPTATDVSSSAVGNMSDDLATDISRRTDRTSYTIPENGSPVTITTNKHMTPKDKDLSQTSLLIEYFEGGKTAGAVTARPSVRVRVTPSGSKKLRTTNDHIQITETGKNRKPSYTRRISLPRGSDEPLIPSEVSEGSSTRPPVEVEVLQNYSDFSQSDTRSRYLVNPSDVSSMPADSLLEGTPVLHSPRKRSVVELQGEKISMDTLKAPSRPRSLSRERITQKAVQKIQESSRIKESSSKGKSSSRRSSRSEGSRNDYVVDDERSPRSRSGRYRDEERLGSSLEPSELSAVSGRSAGQSSVRSGVSATSINNPKLLSAVEDAIKRLILPELNALKEEQKTQNKRFKFEEITRDSMAPAGSRENLRRLSKSSSSPNVIGQPGTTGQDRGVSTADAVAHKKSRRSSRGSTSDKSHTTAIREESSHRRSSREKKSHAKEVAAAAAALAGVGLTAAALENHDSISSLDHDTDRRKRRSKSRSKSRSRSVSGAESLDRSPRKEYIPPLPMQSTIESETTRDSILSEVVDLPASRSSRGTRTPIQHIREISRGSPPQIISPSGEDPSTSSISQRQGQRSYHDGQSPGAYSSTSFKSDGSTSSNSRVAKIATAASLAAAGQLTAEFAKNDPQNFLSPTRGFSPAQSAASYEDVEVAEHGRVRSIRSSESMSPRKTHRKKSSISIDSLSSSPTTDMAFSKKRSERTSVQRGYEIMPEHEHVEASGAHDVEEWFEHEHAENDRYRHELEADSQVGSSATDDRRETVYTQNSTEDDYASRSPNDQDIRGVGANPEYVTTPVAVESAIASLHEPSVNSSARSSQQTSSTNDKFSRGFGGSMEADQSPVTSRKRWETIRDQAIANARHSSDASVEELPRLGASALPLADDDPMPEIGHGLDEGSEVTTNPSIIQGPLGGGFDHEDRSHWPYEPTPISTNGKMQDSHHTRETMVLAGAGAAAVGLGLAATSKHNANAGRSRRVGPAVEEVQDEHWQTEVDRSLETIPGPQAQPYGYASPTANRIDEGYMSNTVAGGEMTPDPYISNNRGLDGAGLEQYQEDDDPFMAQRHVRQLSGLSAGMSSPNYDSSTGKGIDRIQSKDVVALMDHLTVRDAERNARDTEILVTLVRSAAEMRNQLDDLKKHVTEQARLGMQNTDKNTDDILQQVMDGFGPQLGGSIRDGTRRLNSQQNEDARESKRNVFRRVLKGLGGKNNDDINKIEQMFIQLLDEMQYLKNGKLKDGQPLAQMRSTSMSSYENLRAAPDPGYEPEGQAGTSSSPAQSARLSVPSSKFIAPMHSGYDGRRVSEGNRISTVIEGDEEGDDWTPNAARQSREYGNADRNLTPTREVRRGISSAPDTPPERSTQFQNSLSAEETPKTDRSRKHKSNTSSIFSRLPQISRWSKTTMSSAPDPESVRNSTLKKHRPNSQSSRSGSNLTVNYDDDGYSLNEEDRLGPGAQTSPERGLSQGRSPSPLIPEERYSLEDPKYQAHRNSLNLQHPQPRAGPTPRHQTYLESQAVNYENPPTPDQDHWGNTPALALNKKRFSGTSGQSKDLSPVYSEDADADTYSQHSASEQAHNRLPAQQQYNAPPRPPKIRSDEGQLVPSKVPFSHENSQPTMATSGVIGAGYQSPFSNSGMHIASPLEPIAEVRYSLETDRGSGRQQMTPSPRPTAMQSIVRKITGPREMPLSRGSPGANSGTVRRKPISQPENTLSPVQSLESYRGDSDESETF